MYNVSNVNTYAHNTVFIHCNLYLIHVIIESGIWGWGLSVWPIYPFPCRRLLTSHMRIYIYIYIHIHIHYKHIYIYIYACSPRLGGEGDERDSEGGRIRLDTLTELKFLDSSCSSLSSCWNSTNSSLLSNSRQQYLSQQHPPPLFVMCMSTFWIAAPDRPVRTRDYLRRSTMVVCSACSRTPNLLTKIIPAKISCLKISGKFPMDMRVPTLGIKIQLESNPLKARVVVRRLAVTSLGRGMATSGPGRRTNIYIYIYIHIYICILWIHIYIYM